jgi:hypothetical protein
VDDKGEGTLPNPKLSCEDLDMDTSDNVSVEPVCKLKRQQIEVDASHSVYHTDILQWNVKSLCIRISELDIIRRRYAPSSSFFTRNTSILLITFLSEAICYTGVTILLVTGQMAVL